MVHVTRRGFFKGRFMGTWVNNYSVTRWIIFFFFFVLFQIQIFNT